MNSQQVSIATGSRARRSISLSPAVSPAREDTQSALPRQVADYLRRAFRHGELSFHGQLQPLAQKHSFMAWLNRIARSEWVVYAKPSFRWKDHTHAGQAAVMTLQATEFIPRFLLDVLPRGFVKIRHFGFLANRHREHSIRLCGTLLDA